MDGKDGKIMIYTRGRNGSRDQGCSGKGMQSIDIRALELISRLLRLPIGVTAGIFLASAA
jgi:hypothetical protein